MPLHAEPPIADRVTRATAPARQNSPPDVTGTDSARHPRPDQCAWESPVRHRQCPGSAETHPAKAPNFRLIPSREEGPGSHGSPPCAWGRRVAARVDMHPEPTDGYADAVKAVEAVACPVVLPEKTEQGKAMIHATRPRPDTTLRCCATPPLTSPPRRPVGFPPFLPTGHPHDAADTPTAARGTARPVGLRARTDHSLPPTARTGRAITLASPVAEARTAQAHPRCHRQSCILRYTHSHDAEAPNPLGQ